MGYLQLALAAGIVLVLPLLDLPTLLRLKRHTSSVARLRAYKKMLLILWGFTILTLLIAPLQKLLVLHTDAAWLTAPGLHVALLCFAGALFLGSLSQGAVCLIYPAFRSKYAKATSGLRFLLPVTAHERAWWVSVSVSAGVCEELLYRGFLFAWLRGDLTGGPHLSLAFALGVSSLAFGLAHSYQGVLGVLQTSVIGAAFAFVALLTGSIIVPMVLHALIDAQVLATYRPALDAPEEAKALIEGYDLQMAKALAS